MKYNIIAIPPLALIPIEANHGGIRQLLIKNPANGRDRQATISSKKINSFVASFTVSHFLFILFLLDIFHVIIYFNDYGRLGSSIYVIDRLMTRG